jgi:ParB-like chromosome segregation protein Spo0J
MTIWIQQIRTEDLTALTGGRKLRNLTALIASIQRLGLLQPIVVAPIGSRYRVLAGQRRYHACQALGWSTIPAIILSVNDQLAELIAIDTNLTHEPLTPSEQGELRRRRRELCAMISKQRKNRNSPGQAQRTKSSKEGGSPAANPPSTMKSAPRTILQVIGRIFGIHGKSYSSAALF